MYLHLYRYRHYLLAVVVLTIVFGTMYGLVQQFGRMMANDTPALLATQAAKQLDAGLGLSSIQMGGTDLANKPVPFVIVYSKDGKAVGGSGYLDKQLAVVPKGVLTHATSGKNNVVTWQPKDGVRLAAVVVAAKDYYVLGGQSLQQTEARAQRLAWLTLAGYGVSLFAIGLYAAVGRLATFPRPRV